MPDRNLFERVDDLEDMIITNNDMLRYILDKLGMQAPPTTKPEPTKTEKRRVHRRKTGKTAGGRAKRKIIGNEGLKVLRRHINAYKEKNKVNFGDFEAICGLSGSYIGGLVAGKFWPSDAGVRLLCAGFDIPYEHVAEAGQGGKGMMYSTPRREQLMEYFYEKNPSAEPGEPFKNGTHPKTRWSRRGH